MSLKLRKNQTALITVLLSGIINMNGAYAEVEQASTNEFPASVSTVPSEQHEGFVLEWEDGNWSDFMRQLSDATNFQMDSVDLFGMFNSDKDNTISAHDYHKAQVHKLAANTPVEQDSIDAVAEEDKDWRTERKWWQRGSPVL